MIPTIIFSKLLVHAVLQAAKYLITQPLFAGLGINNEWAENPPTTFDVDQENDSADVEELLEPGEQEAIM